MEKPKENPRRNGANRHVTAIWRDAAENNKKLDLCKKPHVFAPLDSDMPANGKYRCLLCDAHVDRLSADWYMQGVVDGMRGKA